MKSDETLTNCNKHRRACSDITMILKQKSPKARADSLNESYSSIDKTPFERIISKRNLIRNAIPEFMTEKKTKQRA